jgi:hypothetical protein
LLEDNSVPTVYGWLGDQALNVAVEPAKLGDRQSGLGVIAQYDECVFLTGYQRCREGKGDAGRLAVGQHGRHGYGRICRYHAGRETVLRFPKLNPDVGATSGEPQINTSDLAVFLRREGLGQRIGVDPPASDGCDPLKDVGDQRALSR